MAEAAVVVPFRGEWGGLAPLLKALDSQTVRGSLETILSVDGLEEPPSGIASMADRVVNGPQAGPAAARNRGWKAASAPFVLFTDGDCVPERDWAERMLEPLRGEFQASKGVYSFGGGRMIQRLAQVEFLERYRIMNRRDSIMLADTYSAGFRRDWLERLGGFDESFPLPDHEDVDLSWRLIEEGGRIAFVSRARVAHGHRESWTSYFRMKMRRGYWRTVLVKRFPARAVYDGYTPQMMKLQMLLAPLLLLSLPVSFLFPWATAGLLLAFLLSCVPLIAVSLTGDPAAAPLVPFFAAWRALALSAGAIRGLTRGG